MQQQLPTFSLAHSTQHTAHCTRSTHHSSTHPHEPRDGAEARRPLGAAHRLVRDGRVDEDLLGVGAVRCGAGVVVCRSGRGVATAAACVGGDARNACCASASCRLGQATVYASPALLNKPTFKRSSLGSCLRLVMVVPCCCCCWSEEGRGPEIICSLLESHKSYTPIRAFISSAFDCEIQFDRDRSSIRSIQALLKGESVFCRRVRHSSPPVFLSPESSGALSCEHTYVRAETCSSAR